jgi:pimeloyl-ACP methyl ester carboxylesterase
MEPSGPNERSAWRLTGLGGMVEALRNLGLMGRSTSRDSELQQLVLADGQAIPVRIAGQGPPVMLVHGLGCSHRNWAPVARRLGHRRSVITWDARGHGQCEPLPGTRITLARLAQDLHELIEQLQLEQVALVGHSMGALTVMQYLQDHGTQRVAAVGVVDQSPRVVTDDEWRFGLFGGCSQAMLVGLIGSARQDLAETVLHEAQAWAGEWLRPHLAPEARLGRLLRRWLRSVSAAPLLDLAESLAVADFRAVLPRLDVPLWVALGGRSAHYAEVPLQSYYQRTVPHVQVVRYERAGHSPHIAEPARFAQDLERFLDDND